MPIQTRDSRAISPVCLHPSRLTSPIQIQGLNPKRSPSCDSLHSTGCQKPVTFFSTHWLTDDEGMWSLCSILPHPLSQPGISVISPGRDCGYCATGIWELFFLVWICSALSLFSSAAKPLQQTRPPRSSLEINSSRYTTGPGRPDTRRGWYLWYGMLSRHLCQVIDNWSIQRHLLDLEQST